MKLSDFATLAEAQAYTETKGRLVSPDMVLSFITSFGLVDGLITNPTTNESKAVQAAFQFGSEFNFIDGSPTSIVPILDILIAEGLANVELKTTLVAYANPITHPFADATQAEFDDAKDPGETLALPANSAQHKSIINIATQPNKSINIVIEERFGPTVDDLTDWHECGAFRGVFYTQQSYTAQIAASPAGIRELRAVSKVTVGMSLEV
tara:strand:- start:601 stop:1227 length:627 start_codon:yes stop_codon:yes gene_type:complete